MFFKTLGKTFVSSGLTNSTERYRERRSDQVAYLVAICKIMTLCLIYHSEATSTQGRASEATANGTVVVHRSGGWETSTDDNSSASFAASWSSLECPLSLEVSLSLSESSEDGPPPPASPFLSSASSKS